MSFLFSASITIIFFKFNSGSMQTTYVSPPEETARFWVACQPDSGMIIGCVALKRLALDDAELCRMSVTSAVRSKGMSRSLTMLIRSRLRIRCPSRVMYLYYYCSVRGGARLGVALGGVLPNTRHLAHSINDGEPPRCKFLRAEMRLCRTLFDVSQE